MESQPLCSTSLSEFNNTDQVNLKCDYMSLLDEANAIGGSGNVKESITQITSVIDKADRLFLNVRATTEMYLDARIMDSTSSVIEQTTFNFDVGEGNFRLYTFAEQFKCKALNSGGQPKWHVLASVAQPVVHNSVPYWSPLLGSFEFSAEVQNTQQKKPRLFRQKDAVTEKREPEKLSTVDKTQDGVEEIVQRMFGKLRKHYRQQKQQPISYYRFVVDPTSFSRTVENIFHLSFLVNDGHVKLELDGEQPMISPVTKGKENSNPETSTQGKDKKQNIFCIDMQTWKALVHVMDIKAAMV